MGSSHTSRPDDLDVPDATFTRPDLTTFTRLDGLGLEVTGQLEAESRRLDELMEQWEQLQLEAEA